MAHSVPVGCYASASVTHFEQAMLCAYHKQTLLYYTENTGIEALMFTKKHS